MGIKRSSIKYSDLSISLTVVSWGSKLELKSMNFLHRNKPKLSSKESQNTLIKSYSVQVLANKMKRENSCMLMLKSIVIKKQQAPKSLYKR